MVGHGVPYPHFDVPAIKRALQLAGRAHAQEPAPYDGHTVAQRLGFQEIVRAEDDMRPSLRSEP